MKNLLFSFADLSGKDARVTKLVRQFNRAGVAVIETEVSPGSKRTAGFLYRELHLTFADSQRVTLRIKESGDIYQVAINGALLPIKNQDDHVAAVGEIAKALDAGRAKFQKKLAAAKVKPPPGIRTAAPKMEQVLTQRRDALKEAIAEVRSEIERVRASNNEAPAPSRRREAWELPMADWIEQQINTGRYASKYANDPRAREARAAQLQLQWMDELIRRSTEGRISDAALNDLVSRVGVGALRTFRGSREPGIAGYIPPDDVGTGNS